MIRAIFNGQWPGTDLVVLVGEELLGAVEIALPGDGLVGRKTDVTESSSGMVRVEPQVGFVGARVIVAVDVHDLCVEVVSCWRSDCVSYVEQWEALDGCTEAQHGGGEKYGELHGDGYYRFEDSFWMGKLFPLLEMDVISSRGVQVKVKVDKRRCRWLRKEHGRRILLSLYTKRQAGSGIWMDGEVNGSMCRRGVRSSYLYRKNSIRRGYLSDNFLPQGG